MNTTSLSRPSAKDIEIEMDERMPSVLPTWTPLTPASYLQKEIEIIQYRRELKKSAKKRKTINARHPIFRIVRAIANSKIASLLGKKRGGARDLTQFASNRGRSEFSGLGTIDDSEYEPSTSVANWCFSPSSPRTTARILISSQREDAWRFAALLMIEAARGPTRSLQRYWHHVLDCIAETHPLPIKRSLDDMTEADWTLTLTNTPSRHSARWRGAMTSAAPPARSA